MAMHLFSCVTGTVVVRKQRMSTFILGQWLFTQWTQWPRTTWCTLCLLDNIYKQGYKFAVHKRRARTTLTDGWPCTFRDLHAYTIVLTLGTTPSAHTYLQYLRDHEETGLADRRPSRLTYQLHLSLSARPTQSSRTHAAQPLSATSN